MGLRRGWGTTYQGKAGKASWFHNPLTTVETIKTPSSADLTPILTEFSIKFELQGTARMLAVHLWNGDTESRYTSP